MKKAIRNLVAAVLASVLFVLTIPTTSVQAASTTSVAIQIPGSTSLITLVGVNSEYGISTTNGYTVYHFYFPGQDGTLYFGSPAGVLFMYVSGGSKKMNGGTIPANSPMGLGANETGAIVYAGIDANGSLVSDAKALTSCPIQLNFYFGDSGSLSSSGKSGIPSNATLHPISEIQFGSLAPVAVADDSAAQAAQQAADEAAAQAVAEEAAIQAALEAQAAAEAAAAQVAAQAAAAQQATDTAAAEAAAAQAAAIAAQPSAGEQTYTVVEGDTLKKLAKTYYGDRELYTKIYERNADTIKNPNLIYVGQTIIIP